MNHLHTMLHKAIEAKNNAYAPYSKFNVGACIKADQNALFSGCNVENAAYGSTICAEAMAIGAMITDIGSGAILMRTPAPRSSWPGPVRRPRLWPPSWLFRRPFPVLFRF